MAQSAHCCSLHLHYISNGSCATKNGKRYVKTTHVWSYLNVNTLRVCTPSKANSVVLLYILLYIYSIKQYPYLRTKNAKECIVEKPETARNDALISHSLVSSTRSQEDKKRAQHVAARIASRSIAEPLLDQLHCNVIRMHPPSSSSHVNGCIYSAARGCKTCAGAGRTCACVVLPANTTIQTDT